MGHPDKLVSKKLGEVRQKEIPGYISGTHFKRTDAKSYKNVLLTGPCMLQVGLVEKSMVLVTLGEPFKYMLLVTRYSVGVTRTNIHC